MNLSTNADSSTNTKTDINGERGFSLFFFGGGGEDLISLWGERKKNWGGGGCNNVYFITFLMLKKNCGAPKTQIYICFYSIFFP